MSARSDNEIFDPTAPTPRSDTPQATRLSRLIEEAHAGQEIILAKAGKPYARLMPLAREPARRQPGRLAGTAGDAFFEQRPDDELDAWDGR